MTNENDRNNPTTDSQGQSPLQPPVTPSTSLEGAFPDNGKGKANEEKNETKVLAREFRIAEKWVIGTNIILAVIGIVADERIVARAADRDLDQRAVIDE